MAVGAGGGSQERRAGIADIRKVATIARDTGISLTVHGVVVGSQQQHGAPPGATAAAKFKMTNTGHDGRGSSTEAVDGACDKPSKPQQLNARARRLEEFNAAKRAGQR